MNSCFLILLMSLVFLDATAQGNKKPKIVGQEPLSTDEDQSITILMEHLDVKDPDDWFYPWGFTMMVYPGTDYSVSRHLVTPSSNFAGKLKVQVTVHDGESESNKFDLEITVNAVNDKPLITGHAALSVNESQSITIQAAHLTVSDPDNKYPDDFSMKIHAGTNYRTSGNTVTPVPGFSGQLSVNATVNDGQLDSDPYGLPVEVKAVDRVPQITGQASLQINEDESITILLSHLAVEDDDNNYPEGFSLSLSAGTHYTFSNSTVNPAADFFGKITVPVTVNDGKNTSKPFNLIVNVAPVNDIPRITGLETEPLFYAGDLSVPVTETVAVTDVDTDSIMFAEVGFRTEGYQVNADKLAYSPGGNSGIRGVFDANTGVLTLLGQGSPAGYSAALKSVYFQTLAPSPETKVLYMLVNDGKTGSEAVERKVSFGRAAVSLDIPSVFTPNGDKANDTWKIVPLKREEEYSHARIKVYNKMGILVYETIGITSEWDGRMNGELLPADTYFYTIDLNTATPQGYLKGVVTILR